MVYIGKLKNEKEKYVKESPEILRRFFRHYGVPTEATVLSDNGNSFFEGGDSVLKKCGFENHELYPANVHQWLSENDNRLHGTSKHAWRSSGVDFSDDVESCLTLLEYLDRDIIKYGKYWFDRNLLKLKESGVEELIQSAGSKQSPQEMVEFL